jgi:hypothetical protein
MCTMAIGSDQRIFFIYEWRCDMRAGNQRLGGLVCYGCVGDYVQCLDIASFLVPCLCLNLKHILVSTLPLLVGVVADWYVTFLTRMISLRNVWKHALLLTSAQACQKFCASRGRVRIALYKISQSNACRRGMETLPMSRTIVCRTSCTIRMTTHIHRSFYSLWPIQSQKYSYPSGEHVRIRPQRFDAFTGPE